MARLQATEDHAELPLPPGQALLVAGAANWQLQDRYLPPEVIAPLQVVLPEGVAVCRWFDRYRDVGVSSIHPGPDSRSVVYTTGADLVRLRLDTGVAIHLAVPDLDDVHELTPQAAPAREDGQASLGLQSGQAPLPRSVLMANTGHDEALEVDLGTGTVAWRRHLGGLRSRGRPARAPGEDGVASFHLNQVFRDGDRLLGLVHHIEGFRLFSHAQRRLTGHGSGGVIDLETGWRKDLRLHAPHTVRRHRDGWLVLNSGRREAMLLDGSFDRRDVRALRGWGRGGVVVPGTDQLYAGISGIRRRYARPGDSTWTGVEMVDLGGGQRCSLELPSIEQVNGVELCSLELGRALAALDPAEGSEGAGSKVGQQCLK